MVPDFGSFLEPKTGGGVGPAGVGDCFGRILAVSGQLQGVMQLLGCGQVSGQGLKVA